MVAAASLGAFAVTAGAALFAGAVYMARTVVTPPARKIADVPVLSVDRAAATVTLGITADSVVDGQYSLWFDGENGHARIGRVLERSAGSVVREVLQVDRGYLVPGQSARIGAWLLLNPDELGLPFDEVVIETPVGPAPAWQFPAERPSDLWAIQVHGRGVQREEGLRAVTTFREAGYTSLLISYRNDTVAPSSTDGMYALGGMEWLDVEAAMRHAIDHGARAIVLMGWSMGGALVLQTVSRSRLSRFVTGVVLDSPVVDWVSTLRHHARLARLPGVVGILALALLGSRFALRLTRQAQPIDFASLDFVARADELQLPILLLHSDDDAYVPAEPSAALAMLRPDIVTYHRWTGASHTRLWNHDPARWSDQIRQWLRHAVRRLSAPAPGA